MVGISQDQSPIKQNIPGIAYDPNLRPGVWFPDRNNFGPRVGLAYRISDSTAIRGGYGIFYAKTQGNELQFKINAPPLVFAASHSPTHLRRIFPSARWRRFRWTRATARRTSSSGISASSSRLPAIYCLRWPMPATRARNWPSA